MSLYLNWSFNSELSFNKWQLTEYEEMIQIKKKKKYHLHANFDVHFDKS